MAFFVTPRFQPAFAYGCPAARPVQRQPRPSFPSFVPFLAQVDELLSEIDRESRREAARQQHAARQQRKRAFRARFDVRENKESYEVEGEVPGFEQHNIQIEVTDEHTLRVAGNTEIQAAMDGVTLAEQTADAHSDTESNKSYQATVEDDFEDLGAETSSTVSAPSEPKGKEKAVEPAEAAVQQQATAEVPAQEEQENRQWLNEREHGSFERTFRFPERIDVANVRAALKNGVLSVNVPKAPAPEIRQISIQ
ncbi:HSP20-like chaperone [Polyplosphaeria fusca]|uniref:HSP20-like chaperone n=1 Tax=Polyplosphaeria fusca TaxID=682080 RepID=A0A9P4QJX4_9PLEO|nr:HSP20-like chaperone [Polyplosphaeria fusca]